VKARIDWGGGELAVDFSRGRSLAIELNPRGRHPTFFSNTAVKSEPLRLGGFVGHVASGGSCNAEVIEFSAHSHGTHTECVGHICPERQAVLDTIDQKPTLLRLITVPQASLEHGQFIPPATLAGIEQFDGGALAVRTMPNEDSKRWRDYNDAPGFPVFSNETMQLLSGSSLMHLLVDTPSLDASESEALENHRMWWGKDAGAPTIQANAALRSVTEMIFVPDDIPDGEYWLELQLAPIVSDAVPSRPVIYPVERRKAGAA
jgi:kynurenine formamidase